MNSAERARAQSAERLLYIVDDEPMLLELAVIILREAGYETQVFRDPREALEKFRSAQPAPAMVITDYAMQPMTGLALMEACKKLRPGLPVLMISGSVGEEFFQTTSNKPDAFLPKPYTTEELVKTVGRLLGGG